MRIFVTGGEGMLGATLAKLATRAGHEVVAPGRKGCNVTSLTSVRWALQQARPDVVVNCAGMRAGEPAQMALVNAAGPHIVHVACETLGVRLIHVSTDCVVGGEGSEVWRGPRPRSSAEPPCPGLSPYARTKLAGEVNGDSAVSVRTSFVGPRHGLWHWLAEQPQYAVVEGWRAAYWSGSTVQAVGHALLSLAERPEGRRGIVHLATQEPISKHRLLMLLAAHLERDDLRIMPGGPRIDRSLAPTIVIPPFEDALKAWDPTL